MSIAVEQHFFTLRHNREYYERLADLLAAITAHSEIWRVAKSLSHGGALAFHAHSRYLPAVRSYCEYVRHNGRIDPRSPQARVVRARLGSNARRMYETQRPVFNLTLDLLLLLGSAPLGGVPLAAAVMLETTPFKRQLQERCWLLFKHAEQRWLAHARSQG